MSCCSSCRVGGEVLQGTEAEVEVESSRKTCGSLYTSEKGGDEDGIEGVVGKAAELWSGKFGMSACYIFSNT
jgi:hypothetical protein